MPHNITNSVKLSEIAVLSIQIIFNTDKTQLKIIHCSFKISAARSVSPQYLKKFAYINFTTKGLPTNLLNKLMINTLTNWKQRNSSDHLSFKDYICPWLQQWTVNSHCCRITITSHSIQMDHIQQKCLKISKLLQTLSCLQYRNLPNVKTIEAWTTHLFAFSDTLFHLLLRLHPYTEVTEIHNTKASQIKWVSYGPMHQQWIISLQTLHNSCTRLRNSWNFYRM